MPGSEDLKPGYTRVAWELESIVMCLRPASMWANLDPGSRETIHAPGTIRVGLMSGFARASLVLGWAGSFVPW